MSNPQKTVLQYTKDGEFVDEYVSACQAAREVGVIRSHISSCCLNKYGFKTAGGFRWRFK